MIRAIVFDIGDVLAKNRLKDFLAEKGFDAPTVRRIIRASVFSPAWGRFERGELTEEEALQAFAAGDPELKEALDLAYRDISGMLVPHEYAIPLVRSLKDAGYAVYYLSNYSEKAFRECADTLAFAEYADGGILSFEVGLTKPDESIYRLFLTRFSLEAADCLFVDDTEENVSAARALGFSGIVFRSYEQLSGELEAFGVRPGDGPCV